MQERVKREREMKRESPRLPPREWNQLLGDPPGAVPRLGAHERVEGCEASKRTVKIYIEEAA